MASRNRKTLHQTYISGNTAPAAVPVREPRRQEAPEKQQCQDLAHSVVDVIISQGHKAE